MGETPSLWPYLIPALPALVLAVGTFLGVWWSRRGVEATQDLTVVQISVAKATVGKTEAETVKTKAEAESLAVSSLSKALEVADKTVDKLSKAVAEAEAREKMLEKQLEREVAWRQANQWPGPPGDGCM